MYSGRLADPRNMTVIRRSRSGHSVVKSLPLITEDYPAGKFVNYTAIPDELWW